MSLPGMVPSNLRGCGDLLTEPYEGHVAGKSGTRRNADGSNFDRCSLMKTPPPGRLPLQQTLFALLKLHTPQSTAASLAMLTYVG